MPRHVKPTQNSESSTEQVSPSIRNLGIGISNDGTWVKQSDWGFGDLKGFTLLHKTTGAEIMFCVNSAFDTKTVKGIYLNEAEEEYLAQVLFEYDKAVGPCQAELPQSEAKVTALQLRRYVDTHYAYIDVAGPSF